MLCCFPECMRYATWQLHSTGCRIIRRGTFPGLLQSLATLIKSPNAAASVGMKKATSPEQQSVLHPSNRLKGAISWK